VTYNLNRKADRFKAAADLARMCIAAGAEATVKPAPCQPLVPSVRIVAGEATVGVDIKPGAIIVPWNVESRSEARFSPAFGAAVGAEVNRFHRRKCMGVYDDLDQAARYILRAIACVNEGMAFEQR
jgi:hypothetical protein